MSQKKRRQIPHFKHPIIETHCHLDYLDAEALQETLSQSFAVGIERIITIAVSAENLEPVLALTRSDPRIWGTQGVHPHDADEFSSLVLQRIAQNCSDPRIVAVGEIGLDYHYDHADRQRQRLAFEQQLQLAVDLRKPVVIHTREADDDTRSILQQFSGKLVGGVIHSFTSGLPLAEYCLDEGFMLGFNGITTFNNADNVRAVVSVTPLDQLLLETDAPYLTPVPYRGKPNAPYYLPFIAERLAQVKQLDVESLLAHAYRNSMRLFFESE